MSKLNFPVAIATCLAACSPNSEQGGTSTAGGSATADSIVLERTVCFGTCPAYRLRIAANGSVLFEPRIPSGQAQSDSISASAFGRLLSALERGNFFSLPANIQNDPALCALQATDHPSVVISVYRGPEVKQVQDYTGCHAGPADNASGVRLETLRKLDEVIDSTAGSARWVRPASRREAADAVIR
jgi:hypothetical protein